VDSVLKSDRERFKSYSQPAWTTEDKPRAQSNPRNVLPIPRGRGLGPFIMDKFSDRVHQVVSAAKKEIQAKIQAMGDPPHDPALLAPHKSRLNDLRVYEDNTQEHPECGVYVTTLRRELGALMKHVDDVYTKWARETGRLFTDLSIETRQDRLRALSKLFARDPPLEVGMGYVALRTLDERMEFKASYAYHTYVRKRFPWDVATSTLCRLKAASAPGVSRTVVQYMHDAMRVADRGRRR